ncbi:hypothetical protein N0824_01026 [Microcystis sp. 0824]|uniref:Uncharacterized protein n=1 Tax=Microcystis aeruginosa NIES-2549 TaxID=1641812 RepID=A0A0F6U4V1_MICAE|nr:hypothetical protein MYAER_2565 [Microcystis aeruginosa NIES-2549]AOC53305.1 hypothetical protein amyaer_2596 [Microcystis aeruginosa NIES-2481]GBF53173.1 hypothetical protein N0824_01026 [Microcystis sp. 0824]
MKQNTARTAKSHEKTPLSVIRLAVLKCLKLNAHCYLQANPISIDKGNT